MAGVLAPALVASLLQVAALTAEVGVRADLHATSLDAPGSPEIRQATASAEPSAGMTVEGGGLHADARYAPRLWTAELSNQRWLVTHVAEARLGRREETWWSGEAFATATRGTTDPLSSAAAPASRADGTLDARQFPTTAPLGFEELRTGLLASFRASPRTTIAASSSWHASRATGADAGLLPPQRGVYVDGALTHALTERDEIRLALGANAALTEDRATGIALRTGSAGAVATWRRRLTPSLDGWVGAGVSVLGSDRSSERARTEVEPAGEIGVERSDERLTLGGSVRVTTFVDRYTGSVAQSAEGTASVRWRAMRQLSIASTVLAGARLDGVTAVGRGDLRATWALRDSFGIEVGALASWQHEEDPARPTFVETAGFVGIAWTSGRLFGEPRGEQEP